MSGATATGIFSTGSCSTNARGCSARWPSWLLLTRYDFMLSIC